MCLNNNPSNCWNSLKLPIPKREIEISGRDGCESRKKLVDAARLNPKRFYNGKSAAKLRTGEGSTTRARARRVASDWRLEVVGVRKDEDIVLSLPKW